MVEYDVHYTKACWLGELIDVCSLCAMIGLRVSIHCCDENVAGHQRLRNSDQKDLRSCADGQPPANTLATALFACVIYRGKAVRARVVAYVGWRAV